MTIRVCDIDPLFVITGLHHTAGDTMMATSFIPFNTAKNPYLLDNVTVVNSPLLGCWKNISEWKQCQWVKKKKTFLLRQRLKNIETLIIKEDSKKRSYILAHTHTRTRHTQCSESVHLSSHHLPSLSWNCRHPFMQRHQPNMYSIALETKLSSFLGVCLSATT